MDKKDERILQVLEKDAKISGRAISERVGLPIATVHRRVKKLEKNGVIKGYAAKIEYEKTNRPIGAYIFINIAERTHERGHVPKSTVINRILKHREIHELVEVQGSGFDLVAKTRLASLKDLSALVERFREIEGIEELFSSIITEEIL